MTVNRRHITHQIILLTFLMAGFASAMNPTAGVLPSNQFINPVAEGADPWVVRDVANERYLWCMSDGNRGISIHASERLTSMGEKHVVWRAPQSGMVSREIWAPELHLLDDHWYIYFAASDGRNENHLAYVLKSKTSDPLGEYDLHGPFATGEGDDGLSPNIWAIDMTVLELNGERYAVWSGWDAPGTDQQFLYIAPMESPTKLSGTRVQLCANDDYLWERVEPDPSQRGLNEGPQVFQSDGRTFLFYSCGASWLPTYKVGLLEFVGDNPLDPQAWRKHPNPVFQSTATVYGVGHSCFVESPDDQQWWHIFHAKQDTTPGWRRSIFVQPMSVDQEGFPVLGKPINRGTPIERPAGEEKLSGHLPIRMFADRQASPGNVIPWAYYGHHQMIDSSNRELQLGRIPEAPINDYRCGEKIVLETIVPSHFTAEVSIDFLNDANARDAGILFRCTAAAVGYDSQRGYFAGLIPRTGLVVLGKTNGRDWTELSRAETKIDVSKPQRLAVQIIDDRITVTHNGKVKLNINDSSYANGSIGLRVVDSHARFTDLSISQASSDSAEKPNIVLINIDDLGYADIGPFGADNKTPNLDRMASEGRLLTSHYAAPVCSPSRAALMTGCYPKRALPTPHVLFPAGAVGLSPDEVTIAELLKDEGYATACFGKWHLGDQPPFLPTNQGFDVYFGIPYSNDMGPAADGAKSNPDKPLPVVDTQRIEQSKRQSDEAGIRGFAQPPLPLLQNDKVVGRVRAEEQAEVTRLYTERATAFIREHQNEAFFVYLPHTAVHFPLYPSDKFLGKSPNGLIGDWAEEVDWSVGEVLQTIRELNLQSKTLVFFTSDNGGALNHGSNNHPLRGSKGQTFEGGIRTCTLAWWPGKIPAGTSTNAITSMMDLLPTLAKLAGASLPTDRTIDGVDIWPVLAGDPEVTPRDHFFYFRGLNLQAVRSGPWKLHLSLADGVPGERRGKPRPQLFNLVSDIGETSDLAAQHPELVERLQRLAQQVHDDLGSDGVGPGCRPLGRVAAPQPLIGIDGTVRAGAVGDVKRFP